LTTKYAKFSKEGNSHYLRNLENIMATAATAILVPITIVMSVHIFGSSIAGIGEGEDETVGIGEGDVESIGDGVGVAIG
jgi:hypothetical protein